MLMEQVQYKEQQLLPTTSGVLNIADIIQFSDHGKSSSNSQLFKGKSRGYSKSTQIF